MLGHEAGESADHDGESEVEPARCLRAFPQRGQEPGQGGALAEAEETVDARPGPQLASDPVAGVFPPAEAFMPPAEAARGQ
jgi:hypothetical protein